MREPINESNRLLFKQSRNPWLGNHSRIIGFVCCVCLLAFGAWYYIDNLSVLRYQAGYEAGVREGKRTAINPKNPSEELEIACAALWVGEQTKKYHFKKR